MALHLQTLCQNSDYLYGMRILAGEQGMNKIVKWVHTIEDIEASNFLHGGELIFTTGIAKRVGNWLTPFVKNLVEKEAAGLVVNVGPYIDNVPIDVLEYANEKHFPVLEVPWKTKLVDITRDFCNQIIKDEQRQEQLTTALKKLMESSYDVDNHIEAIEKYGFHREDTYCVVGVKVDEVDNDTNHIVLDFVISKIHEAAGELIENIIFFVQDKTICMVFIGCTNEKIEFLIDNIIKLCDTSNYKVHVGIGPNVDNISLLSRSYYRAMRVMILSANTSNTFLVYDKLDSRKVLISVDESKILREYYRDTLGNLEDYDKEHETNYVELLQRYIACDGSIQKIAEEENLHRNTINYQLNKIKKILESEISTLEDKFRLMLAFQIKEISQ
jgi:PucR family transcriptional regulator, proline-responsive transcriptional activator